MHQPTIRLPRILGHHRSAYLCPRPLSVSGVLLAASRRTPVIALVAFEEPRSVRLLINGCRLAVAAGDDLLAAARRELAVSAESCRAAVEQVRKALQLDP